MKNQLTKVKDFFGNIVNSMDSKINPTFGSKMHYWSRLFSRILLWAVFPFVTFILVSIGGASGVTNGHWAPDASFTSIAFAVEWSIIGVTIFAHMMWLYFSKWNNSDNKEDEK